MHGVSTEVGATEGGRSWLLVTILCLSFGIVFFDRNSLNFLMPFVGKELRLDNVQIGLLSAVLSLTWAVSGFFVSVASDKADSRKPLLIAAIICFSLCSVLSGFAVSFLTLIGARFLMGVAEGPILPLSQSLVASGVPAKSRGLAMGLVQSFGSNLLGSFVAPIVLVAIASALGWRSAFWLSGVPGIVCAVLVWRFVEDHSQGRSKGADRKKLGLIEAFGYRNIAICSVLSTLIVGYLAITYTFLPVYLTQVAGYSPGQMSWLMSTLGLAAATGAFVVPAISDRVGRKPVMVVVPLMGCLLPLAALAAPPSAWMLAGFLFAGWMIIASLSLVMATIPSETVSPVYMATALAIVMGVGEICGGVGGPIVAGVVADVFGLAGAMWILVGLAAVSGLVALSLIETAPFRTSTPLYTAVPCSVHE